MNPLDLLIDILPAKYRKWVLYGVLPVAVFVYGVWQATDGDWKAFWPALGTAVVGLIAHANTDASSDDLVPAFDPADQPDLNDDMRAPSPTPDEVSAATRNAVGTYDVEEM